LKVHDVGAGGAGAKERFEFVQIGIGVVPLEALVDFGWLGLLGNRFIHEGAGGIGGAVFPIRSGG